MIKSKYKNIKIIIGGIHPSYFYEYILNSTTVDYIIKGEGDVNICLLLNEIENNAEQINIPGIIYKYNHKIKYNSQNNYNLNKQNTIVDFSSINIDLDYSMIPLEASRGCYNDCTFCSIQFKKNWRTINLSTILNNVEHIYKYNRNLFSNKILLFTDDCFTTNKKRAVEILNEIDALNYGFKYFFEAKVNDLKDGYILKNIDKKRIHTIQIGVDNGYNKGLKKIRKGITLDDLYICLDAINKNLFTEKCFLSFIIGYPWETKEDILLTINTIEFIAKKYNIICNINYLYLLYSSIWNQRQQYKINIDENVFDNPKWHLNRDIFEITHPLLNSQDISEINHRILKLYNSGLPILLQNAPL